MIFYLSFLKQILVYLILPKIIGINHFDNFILKKYFYNILLVWNIKIGFFEFLKFYTFLKQ